MRRPRWLTVLAWYLLLGGARGLLAAAVYLLALALGRYWWLEIEIGQPVLTVLIVQATVIGIPLSLATLAAGNGLLYQEEWARRLAIGLSLYCAAANLVEAAAAVLWPPLTAFTIKHQHGPQYAVFRGLVSWAFWVWVLHRLSHPVTIERLARPAARPKRRAGDPDRPDVARRARPPLPQPGLTPAATAW